MKHVTEAQLEEQVAELRDYLITLQEDYLDYLVGQGRALVLRNICDYLARHVVQKYALERRTP